MKRAAVLVLLALTVLGVALLSFPQTRAVTATITLTIPAALELQLSSMRSDLYLASGTSPQTAISLRVGTNDWPLDLRLSLLPSSLESPLAFEFHLCVEGEVRPSLSWTRIPVMLLSPPVLLPSPGWTSYTLSVRATAQDDTAPGIYVQILRMILRSTSGLVEIRDISVPVTVLPSVPGNTSPAGGQGGIGALEPVDFEADILEECEQVLIITWEGVTVVNSDCLPCEATDSE